MKKFCMKKYLFLLILGIIFLLENINVNSYAATYGTGSTVSLDDLTEEDLLMDGCIITKSAADALGSGYRMVPSRDDYSVDTYSHSITDSQFLKVGQSEACIIGSPKYVGLYKEGAVCYKYYKHSYELFPDYWEHIHCFYPVFSLPSDNSSSTSSHTHEWIEGEIYSATQDKDGLGGVYCKSCGAIQSSYPISAYGYSINDYATPMVNASKAGQTVTFELGEWNSFPKAFMEKIAAKSAEGVTFVFHYKWNHVKQEITIPAGTQIDLNFDWYGPAKMAELYGAN